jgi:hypothetical protein
MAQISSFFGIIIWMYYDDHNPPHFHATYAEFEVKIAIKTFEVLEGYLPPRVLGMVIEWTELHQKELWENWKLLHENNLPKKIPPLK